MDVEIAFTGVPVADLAVGRDFFDRLFGRPADVEVAAKRITWIKLMNSATGTSVRSPSRWSATEDARRP